MSLGKGLGALITSTGPRKKIIFQTGGDSLGSQKMWVVPLSEIKANPKQPRKHFSEAELKELAGSIKEHGILQPLLVAEKNDGGYELIAGERRLRAAELAGITAVPVIVKVLAEEQKLEVALIENIQREDLNPIEEAFAYKRLIEEFGLTQQQVADKVGKARPTVANMVRLLELPAQIQTALIDGKINTGQARALLSLSDTKQQLGLLASMLGQKITVRELERVGGERKNASRRDPNLRYVEDQLRGTLGTKVAVTGQGNKGNITISYYSAEELKKIVRKIMGV